MNPEQEGDMQLEGLSPWGAGGLASFVLAVLAGVGWLWRERQKRPLDDAEQGAGIERARMDEAAAIGMRAVVELLRQEVNTHAASLQDLRMQNSELARKFDSAQGEVLTLRVELKRVQDELDQEKRDNVLLKNRIGTLEREMQQAGLELPR